MSCQSISLLSNKKGNSNTRSSSSGNGFGSFGSGSNSSSQDFNRWLFMKKLLIIYLIISFLMVFVYAIFVVNAYVSIKYEVETIDNDAIINMVYQIFDTGVTINFIWFAINTIIILGLYIKLRRKWKIIWLCKRLHNVKYWTWNRNPKARN